MNAQNIQIEGMHQVELTTADLARSIGFYCDVLGLPLIASFDPPGLAFFQVGDVRLSLQKADKVDPKSSGIYFRVADIDAATESLKQHSIPLEQEPALVFRDEQGQFGEAGEEEWMTFFRDPDGHLLAFATRTKP
jgi:catechol 2,3-dioxygenase-like lactoylglutathione lyase family enzyme